MLWAPWPSPLYFYSLGDSTFNPIGRFPGPSKTEARKVHPAFERTLRGGGVDLPNALRFDEL
jgi:hypothetical protein